MAGKLVNLFSSKKKKRKATKGKSKKGGHSTRMHPMPHWDVPKPKGPSKTR